MGADAVVGTTQRFGVPLGFGGPHAAYLAVRDEHRRTLPGPPRRRVDRRARAHRVPARAADARAAHPAREGDEQHLHRAGAARGHRGLYAAYHGADGLRAIARRVHRLAGRARGRVARRRRRGRARALLRHADGARPGRARPRCSRPRPRAADQPAPRRRRHARHRARRDDDARDRAGGAGRVRRRRRRSSVAARSRRRDPAGAACARRSSSRIRRSRRTAPRPDAALPAPPRRPRPRARPHDDPARFVHDEAQRDRGDGADHVAGVRPHAPVRADRPGARLPRAVRRSRALAGGDHRLRRGVAAAQRGFAGRVRGAARDPQVPRVARRVAARDVCLIPASAHGTNAASAAMAGMQVVVVACDDQRQRRPRRPEGQGGRARRPARAR